MTITKEKKVEKKENVIVWAPTTKWDHWTRVSHLHRSVIGQKMAFDKWCLPSANLSFFLSFSFHFFSFNATTKAKAQQKISFLLLEGDAMPFHCHTKRVLRNYLHCTNRNSSNAPTIFFLVLEIFFNDVLYSLTMKSLSLSSVQLRIFIRCLVTYFIALRYFKD